MRYALLFICSLIIRAAGSGFAQSPGKLPKALNPESCLLYMEPQAHFPGDGDALPKFIAKNLRWPDGDIDVQGRVITGFIVQKDGNLTNFKIVRSLHPLFDAEALRVLRLMPKWKPAIRNGKPVVSQMAVPVKFAISNK